MQDNTLVVTTFGFSNSYLYFMIDYLIAVIFILSLAITAGGILISSHLRKTYKTDFLNSLLFFLVFWFTFGFYAIWGQIAVIIFLKSIVENELLDKINNITVILGSPFLLFAWLMFIKMVKEISGKKATNSILFLFAFLNTILIPGICYLLTVLYKIEIYTVVEIGFIFMGLFYTITGFIYLFPDRKKSNALISSDRKIISSALLLLIIVTNTLLFLYKTNIYIALSFILLFYVFGGFIPLYMRYKTDFSKLLAEGEMNESFDGFCQKHEISKREKEIIHEICKGHSNQQIADRLYISLQTVKDHTHRIYGKTNCTSRAQLIRMVNESVSETLPDISSGQ